MTSLSLVQSLCARARELVSNGHTLPEKRALSHGLNVARFETINDRLTALEARNREVDAFYVRTCLQALKEHIDWRDQQMVEKFKGLELGLTALHTEIANHQEAQSVWNQHTATSLARIDVQSTDIRFEASILAGRLNKAETAIEEVARDTDEFIANVDSRLAAHETNVTSAIHAAEVSTSELAKFRAAVNRVLRIEP